MLKISNDLSSYPKRIFIFDDKDEDAYGCIIVSKAPVGFGKKINPDPTWEPATIKIQAQTFSTDYVDFLVEALIVAKVQAELLDKEFPVGTKIFA